MNSSQLRLSFSTHLNTTVKNFSSSHKAILRLCSNGPSRCLTSFVKGRSWQKVSRLNWCQSRLKSVGSCCSSIRGRLRACRNTVCSRYSILVQSGKRKITCMKAITSFMTSGESRFHWSGELIHRVIWASRSLRWTKMNSLNRELNVLLKVSVRKLTRLTSLLESSIRNYLQRSRKESSVVREATSALRNRKTV